MTLGLIECFWVTNEELLVSIEGGEGIKARQPERQGHRQLSMVTLTFWGLKMILYFLLLPDILSALTISGGENTQSL